MGAGIEAALVRAMSIRHGERTASPAALMEALTAPDAAASLDRSGTHAGGMPEDNWWLGGPTSPLYYERYVEGEVPDVEYPVADRLAEVARDLVPARPRLRQPAPPLLP